MKKTAFAVAVALVAVSAHAEDWVPHLQVGAGYSWSKGMGDGTWIQEGAPNNKEQLDTKAFVVGLTGRIYTNGPWSVDYHLDYVYYGSQSASVDGVPDNQYNGQTHHIVGYQGERYSPFNGQGHVQGIPLTLDVGYTYKGYRASLEGGVWEYWNTWHESLYDLAGNWDNLSRITRPQTGFVAGARIEKGPFSVSYRYYQVKQDWSKASRSPGLVSGTSMVTLQYEF